MPMEDASFGVSEMGTCIYVLFNLESRAGGRRNDFESGLKKNALERPEEAMDGKRKQHF